MAWSWPWTSARSSCVASPPTGARQPVQPIPEARIAAAIVKAVVYIQLAFIDVLAPVMRHQAIAHHHRAPRRRPPAKGHQDVGHPQRQHRRSGLKLNRFKIGHRPHLHRLPMDTTPTAVHTLVQRSDRFEVHYIKWISLNIFQNQKISKRSERCTIGLMCRCRRSGSRRCGDLPNSG